MEPLNPVSIESAIRDISERIAKGVPITSKRYREFLDADREFDRAFAHAYLTSEGSIKDREMQARLGTLEEREKRDLAEVAYKHADRLAKALEGELRATQSLGASVRMMYSVAGRGEPA